VSKFFTWGFLLLAFFVTELPSQVYQLPDVNVKVESPIKAYIYKKPLSYDPDSLRQEHFPVFLPVVKPEITYASILPYYPPVRYHANLNLSSRANLLADFNYYPGLKNLKSVGASFDWYTRKSDCHSSLIDLSAISQFGQNRVAFQIDLADNSRKSFSQSTNRFNVTHSIDSLQIKTITIKHPKTSLNLLSFSESDPGFDHDSSTIGLDHSSRIVFSERLIALHFVTDRKATALDLDYVLPGKISLFDNVTLGMITDFSHFLPAFSAHYCTSPGTNSTISLSLSPYCESVPPLPLDCLHRWTELSEAHRITLIPWNLNANVMYRLKQRFFDAPPEIKLSFSSIQAVNYPILSPGTSLSVPKTSYQDIFRNDLIASAKAKYQGIEFEQSLSLSLQYLTDMSWHRKPYEALFNLSTTASKSIGKLDLGLCFEQDYNRVDHNYRHLPESIDLSLKASYQICSYWQLNASLLNLFNTDNTLYNSLPSQRRELWIGFRFLGV